jgi:hypothetical protein
MNSTIFPPATNALNEAAAAAYLGVQPQTLAVWRSTGRYSLKFFRAGRKILYRRAALDSWIEGRTATSTVKLQRLAKPKFTS